MNSLMWLEPDFTEVTLTDDALHPPADLLERCVINTTLFFLKAATKSHFSVEL